VPFGDLVGIHVAARGPETGADAGADEGALGPTQGVSETGAHRGSYSGPDSRSLRPSRVLLGGTAGEEQGEQEDNRHPEPVYVSS